MVILSWNRVFFPERAGAQGSLLDGFPPALTADGPADSFLDKKRGLKRAGGLNVEDVSSETRVFELPLDK